MKPVNPFLRTRSVVRRARLKSVISACLGVAAALAFAVPAFANGDATLSVGTNTAGSATSTHLTASLNQGTQSISNILFNLPTSLNFNWAALDTPNRCTDAAIYGPDPLGDCSPSSFFGDVSLTTPLSATPLNGSVIVFDAGGTLPGIALVVIDSGLSLDSRTLLDISAPTLNSGSVIQLSGSIDTDAPVTALDIDINGGTAGHVFKVQSAAHCYPSDALDATITSNAGDTQYDVSSAVSFSGCSNGGWITSGPATGSTITTDAVTFNYQYTGGGSFSKFRCGLVSLSDPSALINQISDCGTVKTGSSKTYTNLANGVYAFRVYKYPSGGGYDLRKFEVQQTDSATSIAVDPGNANAGTGVELTSGLGGSDEGSIDWITMRLPTSVGFDWSSLVLCDNAVAYGPDPISNCPLDSIYGTVDLTMPLVGATLSGSIIAYDSGGSLPDLLLAVQDSSLGVDYRTAFTFNERNTAAGNVIEIASYQDVSETNPAVTDIALSGFTNGSGDRFFKVKPAGYCYPSDTIDTTIVSTNGATVNSIGAEETFNGCSNGGLITSGPATGSSGNSSTVTFNYQYTGSGSFSKFRCGLVKLSDGSSAGSTVDCGTVKAGSSKTYTGLTDGVYAFRVYTYSSYVYDMRKFQVGS